MIRIDLITGFLGAGKTTFIKKYAGYFMAQGQKIGIIENDFGGVNVDMLLLETLQNDLCVTEQILSDGDPVVYKRRLKAKLIAMAMQGFQRILIEPSGIFDMDAFMDLLYDDPVCNWYSLSSVIAVVDAVPLQARSKETTYMMVSQIAHAGKIVFSKCQCVEPGARKEAIKIIEDMLQEAKCSRRIGEAEYLWKDWELLTEEEYKNIENSGYRQAAYPKIWMSEKEQFGSVTFLEHGLSAEAIIAGAKKLFAEKECGIVRRVKGFAKEADGTYTAVNVTGMQCQQEEIRDGQEVFTVIGEHLNREKIGAVYNL